MDEKSTCTAVAPAKGSAGGKAPLNGQLQKGYSVGRRRARTGSSGEMKRQEVWNKNWQRRQCGERCEGADGRTEGGGETFENAQNDATNWRSVKRLGGRGMADRT